MKIIIVGASGRIGKEIDKALSVSSVYSSNGQGTKTMTAGVGS